MQAGPSTPAGRFTVTRAQERGGELVLELTAPVDAGTVVQGTSAGVYVDLDPNPGGAFAELAGSFSVEGGNRIVFRPDDPLVPQHELRLTLAGSVRSLAGHGLVRGPLSAGRSMAAHIPGAAFEWRHRPSARATAAATDHGSSPATATPIPLGQRVAGRVETSGDVDWFSVQLVQGGRYDIYTATHDDTTLRLLEPDGSTQIAFNDDVAGGRYSQIVYTATSTDTYYVQVAGYSSTTPVYEVGLRTVTPPPTPTTPPTPADDHPDSAGGATAIAMGQSGSGRIGHAGDVDCFAVDLLQDGHYTFRTQSSGDTTLRLLDPSGTQVAFNDDDPAGGLHSSIAFVSSQNGTHVLCVAGYNAAATFDYTLETRLDQAPPPPLRPGDDHSDQALGATPLALAQDASGRIEIAGDLDCFRVTLAEGSTYTFQTASSGDTTLRLFDPSGADVAYNDDDPAGGRTSKIVYRAPSAGSYVICAGAYSTRSGFDYTVRVWESAPPPSPFDPSVFQTLAGTDPWHIDFELRSDLFDDDLESHGLRAGSAAVDAVTRERVIYQTLVFLQQKYLRNDDGSTRSGAWRISFSVTTPPGRPGRQHSREAVGGEDPDSPGTLGRSYLDPGNHRKEDNSDLGHLGIFSAKVFGRNSRLYPRLSASDLPYVNGSYSLGDGSFSQDRRFRAVLDVINDWSHALASIVAHEVGHSVGLNHEDSDSDGIMQTYASNRHLSNRSNHMSQASAAVLDQSLGRHP